MKDFNNNLESALPGMRKHAAILGKKHNTDPKDLLQNTVVRAIEKQEQFDGRYFEAWIKRIMTNLAIDEYREKIRNNPKVEAKDAKHLKQVWTPKSRWNILQKIINVQIKNGETELSGPSRNKSREESESKEKEEQINQLINSIRKLSRNCQEILRAYLKGAEVSSQKELAERLSIPKGTVASRFQRCLISLKNIVKKLPEFNQE